MDIKLMAQCLANLITNALEAGEPTVAVTIKASTRENILQLTVTDNGRGIGTEDLPFVFDPLYTTKSNHVGLGLTISQRIIEDHGGNIAIESDTGTGTIVTLSIPRERRRPVRIRPL